jgi:hypothetical protein
MQLCVPDTCARISNALLQPRHSSKYYDRLGCVHRTHAWNEVEIDKLIAYNLDLLQRYPGHNYLFISLDVMPGKRKQIPTESEIASAIKRSESNYFYMRSAMPGQWILPVYHSGEPRWLRDKYLAATPYICLSMSQKMKTRDRVQWARDAVVPGFYYHGLAATGNMIMQNVDWVSVDSASWLTLATMGDLFIPRRGKLDTVQVSDRAIQRMKIDGHHIKTMPQGNRIRDYIAQCGFDFEKLAADYVERCKWNMMQWTSRPWKKTILPSERLFD